MCEPLLTADAVLDGRYRVVAPLGEGGTSEVWEAVDERLGRSVAVKAARRTDPVDAARLRSEAEVLARLRHPNLVQVYDTGEVDERAYVVTELVHGQSLSAQLREGPLPVEQVARVGAEVASALACVHENGIVHRDLKPGNVLVEDETGTARLIDFGIAVGEHSLPLTDTGLVVGTPAYLSPEQVEGRRATAASDVYSLGLVLLEALTGRRAFPGTPTESAGARLVGDLSVPEDVPEGWSGPLAAMTRRDPARRPSAPEVVDLLRRTRSSSATTVAVAEQAPEASADPTRVMPAGALPGAGVAASTAAVEARTAPGELGETTWGGGEDDLAPPAAAYVAPDGGRRPGRRWRLALGLGVLALVVALGIGALALTGDDGGDPATDATTTSPSSAVATTAAPTTTAPTTTTAPPTTTAPTTTPAPPPGQDKQGDEPPGKGKGKD